MIAPEWLKAKKVVEGEFSEDEIFDFNVQGYNIYYLPNYPKNYDPSVLVNGTHINVFDYVFVDFDLKSNTYSSKEAFTDALCMQAPPYTTIVDSGNGVHAYWRVIDMDAKSYLRLSRRLMRLLNTDEAVGKIFQLMRLPGTVNTKKEDDLKLCQVLESTEISYTCEELDKLLPPITAEDEKYCQRHYEQTYSIATAAGIDEKLPPKFGKLLRDNPEVKAIWQGNSDDRSKDDYRLGHLMFANDFTKEEAASVLVNSAKAITRAPTHRLNYANNIIDKIWTFEISGDLDLSESVESILRRSGDSIKGTRLPCHPRIDNTAYGFRLGQVIGLVGGSGIGKTSFSLNMFKWFVENNPDYEHFFIPLEQKSTEIADRWQTMCQGDTKLHKKVHVISNYDEAGNFRHLSFEELKDYILKWQKTTGKKVGCIVIDHIGALKKKGSNDESQDLMAICHAMKAFAVQTNTLLVMQSQTSREKAGIGDLELDKDAAFGTSSFEWYCDYLVTLWQPLKRCHAEQSCPTVTAIKFCKIREKKPRKDIIQEDTPYYFYFDSEKEQIRDMTQDEKTAFNYWLPQATNKRKLDKKTGVLTYKSVPYNEA
jgi:hypothetical protein